MSSFFSSCTDSQATEPSLLGFAMIPVGSVPAFATMLLSHHINSSLRPAASGVPGEGRACIFPFDLAQINLLLSDVADTSVGIYIE